MRNLRLLSSKDLFFNREYHDFVKKIGKSEIDSKRRPFFGLCPKFGNKFILSAPSKICFVGAPMPVRSSAYSDMATLG